MAYLSARATFALCDFLRERVRRRGHSAGILCVPLLIYYQLIIHWLISCTPPEAAAAELDFIACPYRASSLLLFGMRVRRVQLKTT